VTDLSQLEVLENSHRKTNEKINKLCRQNYAL